MQDIDVKQHIYKVIGECLYKNGYLTRNIFKPWNFVKFIFEYKKEMKNIFNYLIGYIRDSKNVANLPESVEMLYMLKTYWANKLELRWLNRVIGRYELLKKYEDVVGKETYTPIKNRICYCLNHSLPYRGDGYVTRSQHMAHSMQKAGFDVVAVTRPGFPWDNVKALKKRKDLPMEEEIDGVKYKRQYLSYKLHKSEKKLDAYVQSWIDTFRELKPEYIIAASNNMNAIPALIAAKYFNIPFYYETRGLWEITRISKEPSWEKTLAFFFEVFYEARVCAEAKGVFTLTSPLIDELENRGVDRNKIYLCPNCADISMFNSSPRDEELAKTLKIPDNVVTIGYLGTIQMYEGLDDLINACAILKNKGIDFRLILVGAIANIDKNNYKKYLQNLAKKVGIEDKLIMPGKVPPTEVPKYYSLMDITPFGRKPLPVCEMVSPIKPLEAMAMEKTVIVSDLKALKEIVKDSETGLYFKKGNIESYAEVLEKAINDKELRERLGKNARKWVEENRQWVQNAQKIKEVISNEK